MALILAHFSVICNPILLRSLRRDGRESIDENAMKIDKRVRQKDSSYADKFEKRCEPYSARSTQEPSYRLRFAAQRHFSLCVSTFTNRVFAQRAAKNKLNRSV